MPRLDERLKIVAGLIRCRVHADIGSDHGHLLKALLKSGRVEFGIAIENKIQPFRNSQRTLADCHAAVRLADGLAGLEKDEADSLSLCGMGGRSIVRILQAFPDRVPDRVIVQPNQRCDVVRRWAFENGYHLIDEQMTGGRRQFDIIHFQKPAESTIDADVAVCGVDANRNHDPAYEGLDRRAAWMFGPHGLRERRPEWWRRLLDEKAYFESLGGLNAQSRARLEKINELLDSA